LPTFIVPVLDCPGFSATEKLTAPLPLPVEFAVIQLELEFAVQEHPEEVARSKNEFPPEIVKFAKRGLMRKLQFEVSGVKEKK